MGGAGKGCISGCQSGCLQRSRCGSFCLWCLVPWGRRGRKGEKARERTALRGGSAQGRRAGDPASLEPRGQGGQKSTLGGSDSEFPDPETKKPLSRASPRDLWIARSWYLCQIFTHSVLVACAHGDLNHCSMLPAPHPLLIPPSLNKCPLLGLSSLRGQQGLVGWRYFYPNLWHSASVSPTILNSAF